MADDSTPKSPPKIRSRQCMFVLYPESQQSIIDYCQNNLPCAWALHDKDTYSHDSKDGTYKKGDLKKPHIHFVCSFKSARWFTAIAKELGVPVNTINKVNNLYKAYTYLWHDGHTDKYQYDPSIVGMHDFEPPSDHAGMTAAEDEQVQILLDMPRFETFNELARWAYEQGCWASFKKNYSLWRDVFLERRQRSARDMAPPNDADNQFRRRNTGYILPDDFPTPFQILG